MKERPVMKENPARGEMESVDTPDENQKEATEPHFQIDRD